MHGRREEHHHTSIAMVGAPLMASPVHLHAGETTNSSLTVEQLMLNKPGLLCSVLPLYYCSCACCVRCAFLLDGSRKSYLCIAQQLNL